MGISVRDLLLLGLAGALLIALYLIPTIVARRRRHKDVTAIFVLNLLGGWLFIPWLIALVWAFKKPTHVNRQ